MSNFRDELRRKKMAAEDDLRRRKREEELRKREKEAAKERELMLEHERAKKRLEVFNRLDPMVRKVLKTIGNELWGGSFLSKRYEIQQKPPDKWVLSHYLGENKHYPGPHTRHYVYTERFEGYTVKLDFSENIEPLRFTVNWERCEVSQESLEQGLLKASLDQWDGRVRFSEY